MTRHKEFDPVIALDAAMRAFWDGGYEGVSTAALTGRMGIGKRSMYDTFGDKRSLYLAALGAYIRQADEHYDAAAAEAVRFDEGLLALLSPPWSAGVHPRGCFATRAAAEAPTDDDEIRSMIGGFFERSRARLARHIHRFVPTADAAPLAQLAWDAVLGHRVRARIGESTAADLPRIVARLAAVMAADDREGSF